MMGHQQSIRQRGVTILEVLISIFVLLIGVTGVIALFPVGVRLSQQAADDVLSAMTAQNALAAVLAEPGLRNRVKAYDLDTNTDGDVLGWATEPANRGIDGIEGLVWNVVDASEMEASFHDTISDTHSQTQVKLLAAMNASTNNLVVPNYSGWDIANPLAGDWNDSELRVAVYRPALDEAKEYHKHGSGCYENEVLICGKDYNPESDVNYRSCALIKFDLTGEAGRTIHSDARLMLYKSRGTESSRTLRLDRLKDLTSPGWTESSVSWAVDANGKGIPHYIDNRETITNKTFSSGTNSYIQWTIPKNILQVWVDNPNSNLGMMVLDAGAGSIQSFVNNFFRSRQYANGAYGPFLTFHSRRNLTDLSRTLNDKDGSTNNCALLLMTSGRADGKLYRLGTGSDVLTVVKGLTSADAGYLDGLRTNFQSDLIEVGDSFRLIGARSEDKEWVTVPRDFYEDSQFHLGRGAIPGYGYLAIITREFGEEDLFRVDILVYKGYNKDLPPEANLPAVAVFSTIVSGDMLN